MIARCQAAGWFANFSSVDVHSLPDVNGLVVEAPVALAYMGPGAGLAAIGALLAAVGVAVFMVVGFVWYPLQRLRAASRRRRDRGAAAATEGAEEAPDDVKLQARFSPPDRFLHHMAFRTIPLQRALADLEDRLYAGRLADVRIEQPVFIASLPRAGTTLLLETLCSSGAFVAYTYRNMPFLFMPLFWNAISHRFHLAETPESRVERAHGDGLTIGYDSAEAFEEALWRAYHPDQYLPDRILPWSERDFASSEFEDFLKNHVRKLIALDLAERAKRSNLPGGNEAKYGAPRYISKNNGNLSRLPEIGRLFPDATVLVPVRSPAAQATSLLQTHSRFAEIHAREPFTRRYMEDIGHFDFGANLRPIDFNRWLDAAQWKPDDVNYWLAYWCAAFGHVLANLGDNVVLVDYEGLCAQPVPHLERIAGKVALAEPTTLAAAAARFRAPTAHDVAALDVDGALLEVALALHQQLLAHCRIDDDGADAAKRGGVR